MNISELTLVLTNQGASESEWFTGDTPIDNISPGKGGCQEGNQSMALTRDANLGTQSSDI